MQLVITLILLASLFFGLGVTHAQVSINTTTTAYHERGGGLQTTAITPSLNIQGDIKNIVRIQAGWEADIVSGASVAVVDAPGGDVDAITSATQWSDMRNTATGGIGVASDFARIDINYTYGHESDYRSHSFGIHASAELFDRNTVFDVSYGRGFDRVCNLHQPRAQEAVDRQRLPNSNGCFGAEDRESLTLDRQIFQGAWTQAWTPIFTTQLTLTTQILNGYQGNPYRSVWLGRSAAQEFHPNHRNRYAGGLAFRIWIQPLRSALQLFTRLYRDTWNVRSITAHLAWDQTLTQGLRFRARARYYNQSRAAFYSDDYAHFPRGQYFTGDRELAAMSSWVFGGRLIYDIPPDEEGNVGPFVGFELVAKFDWIVYRFPAFHYGTAEVPNNSAMVATLSFDAEF